MLRCWVLKKWLLNNKQMNIQQFMQNLRKQVSLWSQFTPLQFACVSQFSKGWYPLIKSLQQTEATNKCRIYTFVWTWWWVGLYRFFLLDISLDFKCFQRRLCLFEVWGYALNILAWWLLPLWKLARCLSSPEAQVFVYKPMNIWVTTSGQIKVSFSGSVSQSIFPCAFTTPESPGLKAIGGIRWY